MLRVYVCFRPIADINTEVHFGRMSLWVILTLLFGPFALFVAWVLIAQMRGEFSKPQPIRAEPDFFQRHATLMIFVLAVGWSYFKAGVSGVIAAAIVVLLLTLLAAVIVTVLQGRKHRLRREDGSRQGDGTDREPLRPFVQRFAKNFRTAIPELMSYVS